MRLYEIIQKSRETTLAALKGGNEEVIAAVKKSYKTLNAAVIRLQRRNEQQEKELGCLYAHLERNKDTLLDQVVAVASDPDTYYNAANYYGIDWFCSLPYCIETKIDIATALVSAVSSINKTYVNPLWENLVERDLETMDTVRYFKVKEI